MVLFCKAEGRSSIYENMSEQEKDNFKLRLQAPYPIDVKKSA